MSRINEKLGLKPAGVRRQMKDAGKTPEAAVKTSRFCPACGHRWVLENVIHGQRRLLCAWCSAQEGFTV